MKEPVLNKLSEKYPFLTICRYSDDEYVGIVQNRDSTITSFYNFGDLPNKELKEEFLRLADVWWWESNRSVPINLFLKQEWSIFRPYMKTFMNKNLEILAGPVTSLNEIVHTKKKTKSITIIRRSDES